MTEKDPTEETKPSDSRVAIGITSLLGGGVLGATIGLLVAAVVLIGIAFCFVAVIFSVCA